MAITGGIKFFEPSLCLFKNGSTAVANSNSANAKLVLNYDKDSAWISSGSTEGVAATITVTLPAAVAITRVLLLGHNFKTYTVKYGGSTDFTNVITINGATKSNISESAYAYDSSYYEVASVTTDTINISCTNVQDPASFVEKYLACLIVTTETGTFTIDGLAKISPSIDSNNRAVKNFNNKYIVQRGLDSFQVNLGLPMVYEQSDMNLLENLFTRQTDYLIWLCGGRVGSSYFKIAAKPFRLIDVYRVQTVSDLSTKYYKDLYCSSAVASLTCVEVEG